MFYVYMIKNSVNKLYTGVTENPDSRLHYHNSKRGAKFTKYISDFKIVFLEKQETLETARKREVQIKKWRRAKKEALIQRYQSGLLTFTQLPSSKQSRPLNAPLEKLRLMRSPLERSPHTIPNQPFRS